MRSGPIPLLANRHQTACEKSERPSNKNGPDSAESDPFIDEKTFTDVLFYHNLSADSGSVAE